MLNTLIFVLCLVTNIYNPVLGIENTLKDDLELERRLKLINKPPIKIIHTEFGDIVDCIDINKQPAFDHPLLKNHTLQREPSFVKSIGMKNSPDRPIFGLDKDQCPPGTVPIRRTTKEDLIQEELLLNDHIMIRGFPGIHAAEVSVLPSFGPYYGVSGINSLYNPKIDRTDQVSASLLWVQNGPSYANNKITAGWHADNYKKTGCYNLRCPGFVQISRGNYLGARVTNTSIYGVITFTLGISINQDPLTRNWWLHIQNIGIGYFPAALFPNLDSANQVGWGGRTKTPPGTPSPPMGSGHFPDNNFFHSCYFKSVSVQNSTKINYGPGVYKIEKYSDKPNCFGAVYSGDQGNAVGPSLQFGGPGGNCGN
ncbi:hypothetical protein CR513_56972, partial [Mucuna pruriens]